MRRALALLLPAALAGCPSDSNAPVLWMDKDGDELHVRLIDHEPPPY
jgi:hypothetical protein